MKTGNPLIDTAITVVLAVVASSGFWAFVNNRTVGKRAERAALLALLRDTLMKRCDAVISKGYKTPTELENLTLLFESYNALGGNGTVHALYNSVLELPTRTMQQLDSTK